jgi:hypothetical protein
MLIPNVTLSFVHVVEPKEDLSGRLMYSCQVLIPKAETKTVAEVRKAIQDAVEYGITKGKITKGMTTLASFKMPLRDGDTDTTEANAATTAGHWYISARNSKAPGCIDKHGRPLTEEDAYSGMIACVDVQFYAFNNAGNKGVACSLQNVLKVADGDRLDGRKPAALAFAGMLDDDAPQEAFSQAQVQGSESFLD